jgi:NAD(P)-dependent dehydrogenase (short-subunit alcohol dehydrogenase family)
MDRLAGKVTVVTGAAFGNGRGIALRFAEQGADLVLADVDTERMRETARMVDRTPVGRVGRPQDVGERAGFLASDAAGFVNGEIVFADGGMYSAAAAAMPAPAGAAE